jgi:transposase
VGEWFVDVKVVNRVPHGVVAWAGISYGQQTRPAYSPDISPIEHVWDALDRRVRQRVPVPANIQQLRTAIEEEWDKIPVSTA